MCPSSKVTRDRRHSPKGRAGLMREWLRLLENKGVDILNVEKNINGWSVKQLLDKVKNRLSNSSQQDFSHEVMEAMSGCLACKACASQCPVKVDVPDFRARFVNLYHSRYFRPLKDHLVANVELLTPLMAKAPKFVNSILSSKAYDNISAATIGYIDTPLLSVPTLKEKVAQAGYQAFDLTTFQQMTVEQRRKFVFIVQDPFTSFYDADVVFSMMVLIEKLGFSPVLLPFKPNGKPQHVKGFLNRFAKTAINTAEFLNQLHQLDVPLIGLDASLALCYRDEYKQTLGSKRGDFHVQLAHEWLIIALDNLNRNHLVPTVKSNSQTEFKLFAHCTEKTALAGSEKQWSEIFNKFGLSLLSESVGCCGMAGTYGHEKVNFENSKGLYELSWQPQISALEPEQILVTGYSCRSQVKRLGEVKTRHPIEALLEAINK